MCRCSFWSLRSMGADGRGKFSTKFQDVWLGIMAFLFLPFNYFCNKLIFDIWQATKYVSGWYPAAWQSYFPVGIYLLKVNNNNTRTRCEICSKLTIKTAERRLASFWCLYYQLWTYFTPCSSVSVVNFEYVNTNWVVVTRIRCLWSYQQFPTYRYTLWLSYFKGAL